MYARNSYFSIIAPSGADPGGAEGAEAPKQISFASQKTSPKSEKCKQWNNIISYRAI